jgi:type II secretory pathway pseudopilin PulG
MHTKDRTSGFTIVELLVAATITIGIVVLLGTMFGSLSNSASRANHRMDAFRDARAALQMMSRDLAGLVKAQPAVYFEIDTDLAGPNVRQLCFLAAAKNRPAAPAIKGDLCAIKYYCSWDATKRAYSLHRYFSDSDVTWSTFKGSLNPNGTLKWTSNGALYNKAQPPAYDETIADFVWNLQVTAYDSSGNIINPKATNGVTTTTAPYQCDPSGSTNPLPASIEIAFKGISPAAARTVISATKTWGNPYDVWKVADNSNPGSSEKKLYGSMIVPYAYDFRTRVDLNP